MIERSIDQEIAEEDALLRKQSAPARPMSVILSPEDIDLVRQWYNAMCDVTPAYVDERDHLLAEKLGFRANRRR